MSVPMVHRVVLAAEKSSKNDCAAQHPTMTPTNKNILNVMTADDRQHSQVLLCCVERCFALLELLNGQLLNCEMVSSAK